MTAEVACGCTNHQVSHAVVRMLLCSRQKKLLGYVQNSRILPSSTRSSPLALKKGTARLSPHKQRWRGMGAHPLHPR